MRVTVDIDPRLVDELVQWTGAGDPVAAVERALASYVWLERRARRAEPPRRIERVDTWESLRDFDDVGIVGG